MARKYWVVGATWGSDDMFDTFVDRGYWEMGYSDKQKPDLAELRSQMKARDRIAIKAMLGQGSPDIRVRAIGLIKEVDGDDGRVYVRWILKRMNRTVPSKGCYGTLHGPYGKPDADWLGQVFRL